jgi:hypothetical protein
MSVRPPARTDEQRSELPWYVYDRHLHLLYVAGSLGAAEEWAVKHWGVVEVADKQQVDTHDYWYLLFAAPRESGFQARDFQARILRQDRVSAIGRDPETVPQYPHEPEGTDRA